MGPYQIEVSKKAQNDLSFIKKRGTKIDKEKVVKILAELENNPRSGIGVPKRLRNHKDSEIWSRRLNQIDRIVYEIFEDKILILIVSFIGHYGDK